MPIPATVTPFDQRASPRDEVAVRVRALDEDAAPNALLIVNISAQGLMARCEREFAVGERLHVRLPVVGEVVAEVRWCLGGRVGCELGRPIPLASR